MLSRVLLGVVKKYRRLSSVSDRDGFIKTLVTLLKASKMYEEVEDSEVEDLVDEAHLKDLIRKSIKNTRL